MQRRKKKYSTVFYNFIRRHCAEVAEQNGRIIYSYFDYKNQCSLNNKFIEYSRRILYENIILFS